MLKTRQEQQEDNLKGDICYLENIAELDKPKRTLSKIREDELNIDGSMEVSMF